MSSEARAHSPAAARNSGPILEVLQTLLPQQGAALEIASGTGQHAACFAAALPGWTWQPTDAQPAGFASITAWSANAGASNVHAPLLLNVLSDRWPSTGLAFAAPLDLIYCANMLHIAPWACCAGLMQGAAHHLAPTGHLVTYGPYLEVNVPTAPGNLAFDASLRAQNPAWGIRALSDVARQAQHAASSGRAPRAARQKPAAGVATRHPQRPTHPETMSDSSLSPMTAPFFIARVAPDGAQCDAWPDQPLLVSLEQGGIDWPSSCRNGTCRTCLGQLRQATALRDRVAGPVHRRNGRGLRAAVRGLSRERCRTASLNPVARRIAAARLHGIALNLPEATAGHPGLN
jgi:hypothetical protein